MLFALMVMPRSRSRSMESRTCSCISRWVSAPVISSKRSASVDLPWSMCAMMQKFRMNFGSIFLVYQFSQLRAGCERSARFSGGPAAFERATHAAQKPCRTNIQFATIRRPRQLARQSLAKGKVAWQEQGRAIAGRFFLFAEIKRYLTDGLCRHRVSAILTGPWQATLAGGELLTGADRH